MFDAVCLSSLCLRRLDEISEQLTIKSRNLLLALQTFILKNIYPYFLKPGYSFSLLLKIVDFSGIRTRIDGPLGHNHCPNLGTLISESSTAHCLCQRWHVRHSYRIYFYPNLKVLALRAMMIIKHFGDFDNENSYLLALGKQTTTTSTHVNDELIATFR